MARIPLLVAIGTTLLLAVVGVAINYWPITLAAALVGAFSLWWGISPATVHYTVRKLPCGTAIDKGLTAAEKWLINASGNSVDPEKIAQLEAFYHESRQLTRGSIAEFFEMYAALQNWRERVLNYLKEHVPNEAFDFDTCDQKTKDPFGRLHKQQDKLRAIIRRLNQIA